MPNDPRIRADAVMDSLIPVTGSEVRGAHDAQMVITEGKAYIVYEANDVQAGEGAWPFIYSAMSIVDVEAMQVTGIRKIAVPGQIFENAALKEGRCFVPRILIKDAKTLRCFFWSIDEKNRESESWYRDYDLASGSFFPKIYPLCMETEDGKRMLTPTRFHAGAAKQGFARPVTQDGPYLFDADKLIDGRRYAVLNLFGGKRNALAELNGEMDTVRILSYLFEPQQEALSEAAVEKMPDGKWAAVLRNDTGNRNYRFSVSRDGKHWTKAEEWPIIQNGSNSKPLLYRYGDTYLLGWQEQPGRSRFNIDVSSDFAHWKRMFSFDNMDFSLQYPSLYLWSGRIYICATHCFPGTAGDRRDSIRFGLLCTMEQLRETALS